MPVIRAGGCVSQTERIAETLTRDHRVIRGVCVYGLAVKTVRLSVRIDLSSDNEPNVIQEQSTFHRKQKCQTSK